MPRYVWSLSQIETETIHCSVLKLYRLHNLVKHLITPAGQGRQKQILGDKANIESHAPFQTLRMRGYAITQHSDPAYLQWLRKWRLRTWIIKRESVLPSSRSIIHAANKSVLLCRCQIFSNGLKAQKGCKAIALPALQAPTALQALVWEQPSLGTRLAFNMYNSQF